MNSSLLVRSKVDVHTRDSYCVCIGPAHKQNRDRTPLARLQRLSLRFQMNHGQTIKRVAGVLLVYTSPSPGLHIPHILVVHEEMASPACQTVGKTKSGATTLQPSVGSSLVGSTYYLPGGRCRDLEDDATCLRRKLYSLLGILDICQEESSTQHGGALTADSTTAGTLATPVQSTTASNPGIPTNHPSSTGVTRLSFSDDHPSTFPGPTTPDGTDGRNKRARTDLGDDATNAVPMSVLTDGMESNPRSRSVHDGDGAAVVGLDANNNNNTNNGTRTSGMVGSRVRTSNDFVLGELLTEWYRPNCESLMYPYIPPHCTKPYEVCRVYMIHAPSHYTFNVPSNRKLLAVPLFELYDNTTVYNSALLASLPVCLSRFQVNYV